MEDKVFLWMWFNSPTYYTREKTQDTITRSNGKGIGRQFVHGLLEEQDVFARGIYPNCERNAEILNLLIKYLSCVNFVRTSFWNGCQQHIHSIGVHDIHRYLLPNAVFQIHHSCTTSGRRREYSRIVKRTSSTGKSSAFLIARKWRVIAVRICRPSTVFTQTITRAS